MGSFRLVSSVCLYYGCVTLSYLVQDISHKLLICGQQEIEKGNIDCFLDFNFYWQQLLTSTTTAVIKQPNNQEGITIQVPMSKKKKDVAASGTQHS